MTDSSTNFAASQNPEASTPAEPAAVGVSADQGGTPAPAQGQTTAPGSENSGSDTTTAALTQEQAAQINRLITPDQLKYLENQGGLGKIVEFVEKHQTIRKEATSNIPKLPGQSQQPEAAPLPNEQATASVNPQPTVAQQPQQRVPSEFETMMLVKTLKEEFPALDKQNYFGADLFTKLADNNIPIVDANGNFNITSIQNGLRLHNENAMLKQQLEQNNNVPVNAIPDAKPEESFTEKVYKDGEMTMEDAERIIVNAASGARHPQYELAQKVIQSSVK